MRFACRRSAMAAAPPALPKHLRIVAVPHRLPDVPSQSMATFYKNPHFRVLLQERSRRNEPVVESCHGPVQRHVEQHVHPRLWRSPSHAEARADHLPARP